MAEVILSGVAKRFGKVTALDGVDLTVPDGDFVVLLGPTGAGKTTTLRLIAGLETPDAGAIRIGGRDVAGETPAQRDVAMVFQQYSLYPHLTVRENLAFPLRSPLLRRSEAEIDAGGARCGARCCASTTSSTTAPPSCRAARCSGSRSAGRWCGEPAIYLMDEPLSLARRQAAQRRCASS